MIAVSNDFKTAMKQPIKEIQAYLDYGDGTIQDSDDLISFKISCDSGLCKTAMRKLEAKYLGNHNLLGKWVRAVFGVRLPDGKFEYLDYGSFLVTELTVTKDTETTNIVAYDKMVNAMIPYDKTKLNIEYPISLIDYTRVLCASCNLELGTTSFEVMNDWQITQELWENIEGITYRDIFVQIAQATGTICIISIDDSGDDKVYFKPMTATLESLTYDNMLKLKLENMYGPINSLVLSRTPSEDNIYIYDKQSLDKAGLIEFRIENNEIIDKDRENAIEEMFTAFEEISYFPFEATTEGLGWYEIGDHITIYNDVGKAFGTNVFNYSITVDGSIKETLKAVAESKTQTQYQYATSIAKRVKNTEIIVNKQENDIKLLVSDMEGVNEKYTQIYQDIDNIVNSVQNSGGNNLIINSVMFAYNNEKTPTFWELDGDGEIIISTNIESMSNGGLSGHGFTLLDKIARQKVSVKVSGENEKTYYTFSTKIKKSTTGTCYVKLYNSLENHIIEIPSGVSAYYNDFEIKGLLPKENYYFIEFYGSVDSNATFTDNMFAVGEYKSQWTQANGEVMNTQVNINLDGVLVKSSVYAGDYTIMSPLEFAGYSNINGTLTKVFTLNKDTTEVKKLLANDEIKMPPIKIIPITNGDKIGWAFVPTREV